MFRNRTKSGAARVRFIVHKKQAKDAAPRHTLMRSTVANYHQPAKGATDPRLRRQLAELAVYCEKMAAAVEKLKARKRKRDKKVARVGPEQLQSERFFALWTRLFPGAEALAVKIVLRFDDPHRSRLRAHHH
jgi:hypothetical protein